MDVSDPQTRREIMLVFYRENALAVKKISVGSAENRVVSPLAQHKMHPPCIRQVKNDAKGHPKS